jgi:hypothetical protein
MNSYQQPQPHRAHLPAGNEASHQQPFRSKEQMEKLVPIKMQHAAAAFVIQYLAAAKGGWYGEETEVGGEDDRRGIDFRLINKALGANIAVDFSTDSKDGFAVQLFYDWFDEQPDGSYVFRKCYAQALFRKFLPAMNPNNWIGLVGWKEAKKA